MKVIATAIGYDNLAVRQVGDEFDMPDGSTAPWFKPVEGDTKGPLKSGKGKAGKSDQDETEQIA